MDYREEQASAVPSGSGNGGRAKSSQPESQINARAKIVEILTRVDTQQAYTDRLLEREVEEFNEVDRALITEVVNGTLRWRYRLDWYLQQLYVGSYEDLIPEVKNNLRASLYQLMYLDRIPPYAVLNEAVEIAKKRFNQKTANLVNAILRNYLRQARRLELAEIELPYLERVAVRYSHPFWLLQRWVEFWGIDEAMKLCEANNQRPRIYGRINSLQANREVVFKILEENSIQYQIHPDFPEFLAIDNFSEFRKLDLMRKGWISIQDVSTGIPVRLLQPRPGETILDMCAAPGGKSNYIAELMNNKGRLVTLERHLHRAKMLADNLRRFGVDCATTVCADALACPTTLRFDRILLDAPCSGLGVLQKRVDLKWKRSQQDIENMSQLQLRLLDCAAQLLKPGGRLVYSTCTIDPQENEQVVQQFLETHPEFVSEELSGELPAQYLWSKCFVRTFPHRHKMDGSFAVRLYKKAR
ncbi:MAG: 16S rRNA (cytosine(967)-C(5))-methyltransferase RsmB [Calditrichaeota bacterium]|nr:MAG: 16S rRNA (cytosine(967)-C(5))-methyltransferase RsmB [Calditrichota bacterium]